MHITVTNIGSESQTLDDGSQYVYDASGRKFSASSSADIDLAGANGQNSTWLDDINSGNTVQGRIAFDLPAGDKAGKAELHDSMFSGGDGELAIAAIMRPVGSRGALGPASATGRPVPLEVREFIV